jgi:hypothetical protein
LSLLGVFTTMGGSFCDGGGVSVIVGEFSSREGESLSRQVIVDVILVVIVRSSCHGQKKL